MHIYYERDQSYPWQSRSLLLSLASHALDSCTLKEGLFTCLFVLRRLASPHLAGLCPCARTRDVIWGRWFNAPGEVLLSQARCASLGCPATAAAVPVGIQTGPCKCQQALGSLPRHPTSCCGKAPCLDAVLQVLGCLSAVSPSPPFGAAPSPADRTCSPCGDPGLRAGAWRSCTGWRCVLEAVLLLLEGVHAQLGSAMRPLG